jgi:hypothetical protein
MNITIKELTPKLWPKVEELFGSNGACGGCWCMAWRVPKDKKWSEFQGAQAKRHFKKGISDKKIHGALAFIGNEPTP